VFARRDGHPIGYDAVIATMHEIYERANVTLPRSPWHTLRHTFGTQLGLRNTPPDLLRRLIGHKRERPRCGTCTPTGRAIRAAIDSGSQRAASSKSIRSAAKLQATPTGFEPVLPA